MADREMHSVEKVAEKLKRDGWTESLFELSGGVLSATFSKDREAISIRHTFHPDKAFIQERWPSEREC